MADNKDKSSKAEKSAKGKQGDMINYVPVEHDFQLIGKKSHPALVLEVEKGLATLLVFTKTGNVVLEGVKL